MSESKSQSGRLSVWGVLWGVAGGVAFTGLVLAMVVVGGLWPFGGHEWLVLPFLLLPVAVPAITVSQRPGRLATALALLAAAGVVALGLVCAALMTWAKAHDWIGDRCCDAVFTTPWTTWRVLMLVYTGLGVVLLGVLIFALLSARHAAGQLHMSHLEGEVS